MYPLLLFCTAIQKESTFRLQIPAPENISTLSAEKPLNNHLFASIEFQHNGPVLFFKTKKIVNCNLFTNEALRSSYELVKTCPCVPDRIGIGKCCFLRRGGNQSTRRKTSRSKGENQQQTQPTYGFDAGSWTRATMVGGECSHHCHTLAAQTIYRLYIGIETISCCLWQRMARVAMIETWKSWDNYFKC